MFYNLWTENGVLILRKVCLEDGFYILNSKILASDLTHCNHVSRSAQNNNYSITIFIAK